jgi:hypothetical protein
MIYILLTSIIYVNKNPAENCNIPLNKVSCHDPASDDIFAGIYDDGLTFRYGPLRCVKFAAEAVGICLFDRRRLLRQAVADL